MAFLITSQEIKTNTSMGGNVDADKYMHLLNDVQNLILEPAVGTALFDVIVAGGLSGDYQVLLDDYIKPLLWHSVFAEYLRDGIILAANGGVFTHQADNSAAADIDAIKYVAKGAKSKADSYLSRMEDFLCDKTAEIPEYNDAQANNYDIDPDKDINTSFPWHL